MYRVAIKEVKRYVYEYGKSAHTKGGAMNKKKTRERERERERH